MPHLIVPEDTFQRLSAKAEALNISVEELIQPALDRLAGPAEPTPSPTPPLTGDAWDAELEAWKQDARDRTGRYPRGFVLDDSRETLYREREDAQL
ncbi:MAG: hypothetical protein ACYC61_09355 [Isosphaeraceae bacterium]